MAAKLYYSPFIPTFSSNGAPIPGAALVFYYTGTTTKAPVYADAELTTELENPVPSNAAAKYPVIYLDEAVTYRVGTLGPSGELIGDYADPYVPGQALKGDKGDAGPIPQQAHFFATAGQTTFPATGPLIDLLGEEFSDDLAKGNLSVWVNEEPINADEYSYAGGNAPVIFDEALNLGDSVIILGSPGVGVGSTEAGVPLHSYPGTTTAEDPFRLDHNNTQLANAFADTCNPDSPNFGKWVDIHPLKGAGVRHADEWDGDTPIAVDAVSGDPIEVKFMALDGDTLIDDWTKNGLPYITEEDEVAVEPTPDYEGNFPSLGRVRILPGARVRRPPRDFRIIRPLILHCDASKTEESTDEDGVSRRWDVFVDQEVVTIGNGCFVGENHRWGYREHHNDISLNGASRFRIDTKHYGALCDNVYLGAGNRGDGTYQNRNRDGSVRIWADGRNQNNRNALSIVAGRNIEFNVVALNFGKAGGGTFDPFDPNTGVLAPAGGVDLEPNFSFETDPELQDIRGVAVVRNSGAAGVALLLGDNDTIPNPVRGFRIACYATNCNHGAFTTIGAIGMRDSYDAILTGSATDCTRAYELNSGQGVKLKDFEALRSTSASYIGYIAQMMQDFWMDNVVLQELGRDDEAGNQIRGWRGGGMRAVRAIDNKTRAFQYLAGLPIENLSIDVDFEATGTSGVPLMTLGHDVSEADGGADVNLGTIIERGGKTNVANNNWAPVGGIATSIPNSGTYPVGAELRGSPDSEPGSFRTIVNLEDGGARFVIQDQKAGFVPDGTGADLSGWTNYDDKLTIANGRMTAIEHLAIARSGTTYSNPNVDGKAPSSTTGAVYIVITTDSTPTGIADGVAGIWFNTAGVYAITGTSPASAAYEYAYGDSWDISVTGGNTVSIGLTRVGASRVELYTSAIASGSYYVAAFLNIAGETIQLTNVSNS